MNRQAIRDALASNCKTRRQITSITLNDGASIEVAVRGMSVGARQRMMEAARIPGVDEEGKPSHTHDEMKMALHMVMECTRVPDSDERLFEDNDLSLVEDLPTEVIDKLATLAGELSGIKAAKAMVGNSDATPVDASSSR